MSAKDSVTKPKKKQSTFAMIVRKLGLMPINGYSHKPAETNGAEVKDDDETTDLEIRAKLDEQFRRAEAALDGEATSTKQLVDITQPIRAVKGSG